MFEDATEDQSKDSIASDVHDKTIELVEEEEIDTLVFSSPSPKLDSSVYHTPSRLNRSQENSFINNLMEDYYSQYNTVSPFKQSGVKISDSIFQNSNSNHEYCKEDYLTSNLSNFDQSFEEHIPSTFGPKLDSLLNAPEIQSHLQFLTDISNQAELADNVPIIDQLKILLNVSTKDLQERVLNKVCILSSIFLFPILYVLFLA